MSRVVLIALLVTAIASPSAAQQRDDRLRSANRKITVGLVMMGAGALIGPLTAANNGSANDSAMMTAGIGLIVIGGVVVWWGAAERRRALQPQTAITVSVGRRAALQLVRVW